MIREWRTVTAHLLTGFLGSGKTSLLKRLLAQPDLRGTAVLINEFGEVGLDHLLVEEVDEEVVLLKSGCVCCSIRGDLRDGLGRLHARMESGQVPPFERVVIETTGLADPVPIIAGFTADPGPALAFPAGQRGHRGRRGERGGQSRPLRGGGEAGGAGRPAGREQARSGRGGRPASWPTAAATQPDRLAAPLVRGRAGAGRAAAGRPARPARGAESARWIATEGAAPARPSWRRPRPPSASRPRRRSTGRRSACGCRCCCTAMAPTILRVKGLLQVQGVDRPVVVQGVQHLVHKPVHLDAWPEGRPATRLVVIGRDLDRAAIERSFRAFCRVGRARPWRHRPARDSQPPAEVLGVAGGSSRQRTARGNQGVLDGCGSSCSG